VTLKVRFADFSTVTRSSTLPAPVGGTDDLRPVARELWRRIARAGRGIRLLGVAVSGLVSRDVPAQLALDGGQRHAAAAVVDEIRDRFGDTAVVPARLAARPEQSSGSRASNETPQGL
jgi:DNA polymerase-4